MLYFRSVFSTNFFFNILHEAAYSELGVFTEAGLLAHVGIIVDSKYSRDIQLALLTSYTMQRILQKAVASVPHGTSARHGCLQRNVQARKNSAPDWQLRVS